jgi:predicted PurR-regulated permease PerM
VTKFWVQYRRIMLFIIAVVIFFWLVWVLRNVLLPFIIGLILAYLLLPPILWIEKRLPRKNKWMQTKRILLILLIYLVVVAIITIILIITIPIVSNSVSQFINDLPQLIPQLTGNVENFLNSIRKVVPPQFQGQADTFLSNLPGTIIGWVQNGFASGFSYFAGTVGLILGFASLPVFLFYILKDAEKLTQGFYSRMSPWTAEHARAIVGIIYDVLGRYIRSSILVGLAVGTADLIGLLILGIPFAPALAVWAAITELIPIIGPWLGAIPAAIVALATTPDKFIWVVILYVVVQLLEGNLLIPRIHGQYLQIHPAIILVLLVVGAHFAGLWGIILIVPVTSTLVKLFDYIALTSKKEALYSTANEIQPPS